MLELPPPQPLAYHRSVLAHVRGTDPQAWQALVPDATTGDPGVSAALLRDTYRLDPSGHPVAHEAAGRAARALGLTVPVDLYQGQGAATPNATLLHQPDRALQRRGVEVRPDIGESAFRCDLALRRPGDRGYRVAVLVDTPARIASDSTLERLSTHHRALAGAGWVVSDVLTSDWLRDPDGVTDRLIEVLDRTSLA